MKKIIFLSVCFISTQVTFGQNTEYFSLVKKANFLYNAKDFKTSFAFVGAHTTNYQTPRIGLLTSRSIYKSLYQLKNSTFIFAGAHPSNHKTPRLGPRQAAPLHHNLI